MSRAHIDVSRQSDDSYRVLIDEGGSTTTHQVTARTADVERLGGVVAAEALIEASFRFLLDREPKESILRSFDLTVIAHYFPEYPDRIGEYLP